MNYTDENGKVVATTTFKDAQGRYFIDGLEVTKEEYEFLGNLNREVEIQKGRASQSGWFSS